MSALASSRTRLARRLGPGDALLAMSIFLPAILFALASWQSYTEVLREADVRVERTVRILREHAAKVLETHTLVLSQIKDRQRFGSLDDEAGRLGMHELMKRLVDQLDQLAGIGITDREGRLLVSGLAFPADGSVDFSDRDWFTVLKDNDYSLPFVSASYTGRQSVQPVFNLASRAYSPTGDFTGVIAVSVDRAYFERFYQSIETDLESSVTLIRADGETLARYPAAPIAKLEPESEWLRRISFSDGGLYSTRSKRDGVDRMFGYSRVAAYPVYVRFGVTRNEVLAPWRENLLKYGFIAVLTSLSLLGVSAYAIRQSSREQLATQRWRHAATELEAQAASRVQVEDQLRQAQKMEAVGQLTGGIAHDFNNLLTGIIGSLDLLQTRLRQGRTDNLDRYLKAATTSANRAAALTHRLLAFARRQPLDPKPVDGNALVTSLEDLLRRTLGEAIGLEIVTAGRLWLTLCDPHQVESAILNLAINARDAMPDGGRLTIETGNTHLDHAFCAGHPNVEPGHYVAISVTDTGTGMPPDVVGRAFEPFFTTKPIGQGTGLGLSMIYGFARQSEGHAEIYSEVGRGTTVKIYLPRYQGEAASTDVSEARDAGLNPGRREETILVVEDEAVVRELVIEVLQERGFQTLEAADGPAGLKVLQSTARIDLLVSDVGLPSLNGRQMADEARRTRPNLKVLFITGYAENAAMASGFLQPGMEMMTKPFPVEAFLGRVQGMLSGSSSTS